MQIGEMARKAGVTVRTLSYYDKEGLLSPSAESDGGYRLYTAKDMARLIQILMLKELGFPLSQIKKRLYKLETPEDVRAMLAEQSAHVRKKIELLTESLGAMEALDAEIADMETVNFEKYADIFLNLQMKNETYRMIKHFDDDALDMLRERIGREKTALMAATLNDLYKQAAALVAEAVPPKSEKGRAFAHTLWEALLELSGGDMTTMLRLSEQIEKASKLVNESDDEQRTVRHYMSCALGAYQSHMYTGTDKATGMITFGSSSYAKAYELYIEGITPESETAQGFIKTFWETLMELTGGNLELLQQINEQVKNSGIWDEKSEAARCFIESALEVYFAKLHQG